jgi:TonB family protein
LNWPESAIQLDIEGRVCILAYLDSLGNLDSAKVFKSLGFGFDEEALLAVKKCKYTPGYAHQLIYPNKTNNKSYRLKPIKSQMIIPISFYRK